MISRTIKNFLKKPQILRTFSNWSNVPESPKDPILQLNAEFKESKAPNKVNLTIGAYRDENGEPWILPQVKKAMEIVNQTVDQMEYLPPTGDNEFLNLATKIGYGKNSEAYNKGLIAGCQTLQGTGACYIGVNFLKDWWTGNNKQIYISTPTWPIHNTLSARTGLEVVNVPYFDPKTNALDFEGYSNALLEAPDKSIVLLHAVAHNPTGVDPTDEQWLKLKDIFAQKGHIAFFDMAYQGFASGSLEEDGKNIALWEKEGLPFVLGQSFAKSMGLYGMRTGSFSVICEDEDQKAKVNAQLSFYCRQTWSSPPLYGAAIAKTLMGNPEIYSLWEKDMVVMSQRITEMRGLLKQGLIDAGSKHNWDHITNQNGMFAFTGISPENCDILINDHKIYLTKNGRISVAGLNHNNVSYVAEKFHEVTKEGF